MVANKAQLSFLASRADVIVAPNALRFVHFPIKDCSVTDDAGVLNLARLLVADIAKGEVIYLRELITKQVPTKSS
jgi:hypothetical protein